MPYTFVYIVSKTSVMGLLQVLTYKYYKNKITTQKTKQSKKKKKREVEDMKGRLQKKVVNKGAEIW